MKMLRLFHLFDIFEPIRLLLYNVCMKNKIRYQVENMFSLIVLFSATLLFAHILAMQWIWFGLEYEDGWIRSLKAENYDGVWGCYGP